MVYVFPIKLRSALWVKIKEAVSWANIVPVNCSTTGGWLSTLYTTSKVSFIKSVNVKFLITTLTCSSFVSSIPVLGLVISTIPTSTAGILSIYTTPGTLPLWQPLPKVPVKYGFIYPIDCGLVASATIQSLAVLLSATVLITPALLLALGIFPLQSLVVTPLVGLNV